MRSALFSRRRRERGVALVVCTAVILVLAGLSAALLADIMYRSRRNLAAEEDVKSFEAAEAGLDAAVRNLNAGGSGCLGLGWPADDSNGPVLPINDYSLVSSGQRRGWELHRWLDRDGYGMVDTNELIPALGQNVSVPTTAWQPSLDGVPYAGIAESLKPYSIAQANTVVAGSTPVTCAPPTAAQLADPRYKYIYTNYQWYRADQTNTRSLPRPEAAEFDFYRHCVILGDICYFTYAVWWRYDGVDNDNHQVSYETDAVDDGKAFDSTNNYQPYSDQGEWGWVTIWATGFKNPGIVRNADGTVQLLGDPPRKFTTVQATARRLPMGSAFYQQAALEFQIKPFGQ